MSRRRVRHWLPCTNPVGHHWNMFEFDMYGQPMRFWEFDKHWCSFCRKTWPEVHPPVKPVTHRIRRGKIVEIPTEWRGRTLDRQTKMKRQSKRTRKDRNATPRHSNKRMRDMKRAPGYDE